MYYPANDSCIMIPMPRDALMDVLMDVSVALISYSLAFFSI